MRKKTKLIKDIWHDPRVKDALDSGRQSWDISVLACPKCGLEGYYNEGSHFTCLHCHKTYYCCSEGEEPPTDRPYMYLDDVYSLAECNCEFPEVP